MKNISFRLSLLCTILVLHSLTGRSQAPFLVKNIHPSFAVSSFPQNLTKVDSTLFFSADNGTNGFELWKSDGTTAGTVLVKDVTPGSASSQSITQFTEANGLLFFMTKVGRELWVSDGTTANTDTLISFTMFGALVENSFIELNNQLIFVVQDATTSHLQLWKSDGTVAGTQLIKSFNSGGGSIDIPTFKVFNSELYFTANDGISGREVWKSDGTASGTILVKDINTGSSDGTPWPDPPFFNEINGFLYFEGETAATGAELWKTDGTSTGTNLVKDVRAGAGGSGITSPTIVGNKLFFKAFIGGRTSLWVSDGTATGTNKVIDLSLNDFMLAFDSNHLVFTQDNTSPINYGKELWISDGATLGTNILKDINPGNSQGIPTNHFKALVIDSVLFFNATDNTHGLELWKSDGTDTGTVLVKDLNPGIGDGFLNNSEFMFDANGTLFFDAISQGGGSRTELWKSNGTDSTTLRLDIDTNGGGSIPKFLTLIDTTLFLVANDGFTGVELYALYADSVKKPKVIIGPPTSIKEINNELEVILFPNPTSSKINLTIEKITKKEEYMIRILTLSGKEILEQTVNTHSFVLDLASYSNGIYLIQIANSSGFTKTMKVIKH